MKMTFCDYCGKTIQSYNENTNKMFNLDVCTVCKTKYYAKLNALKEERDKALSRINDEFNDESNALTAKWEAYALSIKSEREGNKQ